LYFYIVIAKNFVGVEMQPEDYCTRS